MVQSRSPSAVQISVTPMQVADSPTRDEATATLVQGITRVPEGAAERTVTAYPGEPSEVVVQVKNRSSRLLQLNLQLTGDFPEAWCQLGTEGHELPPDSQSDAVLYFQVPNDWFEDQTVLQPQQMLKLQYSGLLTVQIDPGTERQEIHTLQFDLYVRPRSLYRDFLPSLYREVDFIGRFLKIFEQSFEPVVQSFEMMWAHLDPLTAPVALLPFLATWVGWQNDPNWDIRQQRRLIKQAVELYRWRGTRTGLRLYLHWYTGLPLDDDIPQEANKHISITEPFGAAFVLESSVLGESAVLGGGQSYHFLVRLRGDRPEHRRYLDETLIRKIIDQEKPAFCTYDLLIESH
ncbi:phage tail protein [Phormidium tenue FACHB-886]|nr:phage tail protein [Phormidium tenue FACHB-886]